MWRYEVLYREDGITKYKGFGYKDKFERFLNRMSRKSNVTILATLNNDTGEEIQYPDIKSA